MSDIRHALRAATADVHRRLDQSVENVDLGNAGIYREFLRDQAAALIPIEKSLEQAGVERVLSDWPARRRSAALLQDLADFKMHFVAFPDPTPLTSEASIFGTLYVLEGSRLGGKILLKRATDGRDPQVVRATRYLAHGSGERLWPTFLEKLLASAAARYPEVAAKAANDAFALFERALVRPAHAPG